MLHPSSVVDAAAADDDAATISFLKVLHPTRANLNHPGSLAKVHFFVFRHIVLMYTPVLSCTLIFQAILSYVIGS